LPRLARLVRALSCNAHDRPSEKGPGCNANGGKGGVFAVRRLAHHVLKVPAPGSPGPRNQAMKDLLFVGLTVAFFAVSWLYARSLGHV
jgi:hypothetical protein